MALALVGATQPAAALDTDPPVVDESPALSIGDFEVSRYLLDKNYNQFAAARRGKHGEAPSKEDISAWFRLFIARQAIHARLLKEGFVARPEVERETRRMIRQILTQADGPLYDSLLAKTALTPERLRALHETSTRVFDVVMVRFDDDSTAARRLGPVASAVDFERAADALARAGRRPDFDVSAGPSSWPHGSFQEIADAIHAAPHGTVIGPLMRELGVYFLLVRGESLRSLPDFEATRGQWEKYVAHISRAHAQRVRRRHILRECEFLPDPVAIETFTTHVRPLKNEPHTIDETAASEDSERIPDGRQAITGGDFVRHFNQRIIRSMPRGGAGFLTAIEDMVVEEHDYAAALAARLDQDPKFVQDRRNFEFKQALELYEREVLAPQIAISPAELEAYYSGNIGRYAVTSEATGMLFRFTSVAVASEALAIINRGDLVGAAGRAKQVIDPIVVRRDGPALTPARPNALLLTLPDGRPSGPFEHEGLPAIFVKRSGGLRTAPPLEEIANVVRQDLMREKLDALETALFLETGGPRALRVYFEFSNYGIDNPFEQELEARAPRTAVELSVNPESRAQRSR